MFKNSYSFDTQKSIIAENKSIVRSAILAKRRGTRMQRGKLLLLQRSKINFRLQRDKHMQQL